MTRTPLTRDLLQSGGVDAMVAKHSPGLTLMTEAERAASLHETMAARPPGDVWLFAYGSLIWNPIIRSAERRVARVDGWHRAFCLSVRAGRGTAEQPGLVLGLDAGGHCSGVAFRIAEEDLAEELDLIWRREMLARSYVPRWLDVLDPQGARFGSAIGFTIDPSCAQYAGDLTEADMVQRLATASGTLGSAAEYLFHTRDALRALGIPDPAMERLGMLVEAAQAAPA